MIKLITIGIAGYIVYRIAKSKIKTFLFGSQPAKEIEVAVDLIPCEQCGSFIAKTTAIVQSKKSFCSQECCQSYTRNRG